MLCYAYLRLSCFCDCIVEIMTMLVMLGTLNLTLEGLVNLGIPQTSS